MGTNQSKDFNYSSSRVVKKGIFSKKYAIQDHSGDGVLQIINPIVLLKKLFFGLRRIIVAIKFQLFNKTGSPIPGITSEQGKGIKFPLFKLGIVAFVVFIVLKKDIQFSVDMKAPFGSEMEQGATENSNWQTDEMSLAQTISLKTKGKKKEKVANSKGGAIALDQLSSNKVQQYIQRFSKVAVAEMEKYGIPASIKLAQAILESQAGSRTGILEHHNHFGQPFVKHDFQSAWENWRAHSLMIYNAHQYLYENGKNYKKWAKALQKAGYNNDKAYAQKLITLIETYDLERLDATWKKQ